MRIFRVIAAGYTILYAAAAAWCLLLAAADALSDRTRRRP